MQGKMLPILGLYFDGVDNSGVVGNVFGSEG